MNAISATAISYIRRSSKSDEKTVSLDAQVDSVSKYAGEAGLVLVAQVEDDGVSGGDRERFARIEAAIKASGAEAVVVYHLDRFARDAAAQLDILQAWRRRGITLHVAGRGPVEVDTASGFLSVGVEGLVAEHYRRVIGEKTRDALARLRREGRRYSGIAPYGWAHKDGALVECAEEIKVLSRIRALRAGGASVRGISKALLADGVTARTGRPFAPATLQGLLRRAA